MNDQVFCKTNPSVEDNHLLRIPQRDGYIAIKDFYNQDQEETEIGIVLPVGCGKSGLITLTPFALHSKRALVIAPNVKIAEQLCADFDPTKSDGFYQKCKVINMQSFPEPAEIRGSKSNISDLEEADVVITNIQQLQREDNQWLSQLSADFFDSICFDEAHHNVAASWQNLRTAFPNAKIVNFSATPRRADGQLMAGKIIYSFSIFDAIQNGYVKRLKAVVLNPRTLKYVRREDNIEVEVDLEEVKRLGEKDAGFRRSIVTSTETLNTIVDASIRELESIRKITGNQRHKIIASALNYEHCIQIKAAYQARGLRTDYIHSNESEATNDRILEKLKSHNIDVIVQVRKLGEGFDHPYLSVAAVFNIFNELSPFVQFVGRIMRVIDHNNPESLNNQGVVIFHAGSNIAKRWKDFQDFSEADQDYFDQLLPLEQFELNNSEETITPHQRNQRLIKIASQSEVTLEEIPLIHDDEAIKAIQLLKNKGYSLEEIDKAYRLISVPVTKQRKRQANRTALDSTIRNRTSQILKSKGINPKGKDLDSNHLNKTNFQVLKSAIDRNANAFVGRKERERSEFSADQLETISQNLEDIIAKAVEEVF